MKLGEANFFDKKPRGAHRRRVGSQPHMIQDLFYNLSFIDDGNDPHSSLALGAHRNVYFENFF